MSISSELNESSLTPRDRRLQLATAENEIKPASEAIEAELKAFLETLVRVALAVAARGGRRKNESKEAD